MSRSLAVDTDEIRRAAARVGAAGEQLVEPRRVCGDANAADRASDGTAAYREAMRLAASRAEHALQAADALAGRCERLSAQLRRVAVLFQAIETMDGPGG